MNNTYRCGYHLLVCAISLYACSGVEEDVYDAAAISAPDVPVWLPMHLGNYWIYETRGLNENHSEQLQCAGVNGSRLALAVEPSDGSFRFGSSRILHHYKEHMCGWHWPARGFHHHPVFVFVHGEGWIPKFVCVALNSDKF